MISGDRPNLKFVSRIFAPFAANPLALLLRAGPGPPTRWQARCTCDQIRLTDHFDTLLFFRLFNSST